MEKQLWSQRGEGCGSALMMLPWVQGQPRISARLTRVHSGAIQAFTQWNLLRESHGGVTVLHSESPGVPEPPAAARHRTCRTANKRAEGVQKPHEKSDDFLLKGKVNTGHLHRRVGPEIDTRTSKIIGSSLNVSDFITKEIFKKCSG